MPPKVTTAQSGDNGAGLAVAMSRLSRDQVLIGIPEDRTDRRSKGVTNAQLMFIHTNGSPLRRIPPRPVLEPALDDSQAKELYTPALMAAASAAFDGDATAVTRNLEKAGAIASGFARDWFTNPRNRWAQLSPLTVRRKLARLKADKRTAAQAAIDAQGGDTSGVLTLLIDTGQLRRAITYVVEEG